MPERESAAGYATRAQSHLVFAEHISLGDAVQQGVGDLASGAGHHHTDRFSLDGQTKHANIRTRLKLFGTRF